MTDKKTTEKKEKETETAATELLKIIVMPLILNA